MNIFAVADEPLSKTQILSNNGPVGRKRDWITSPLSSGGRKRKNLMQLRSAAGWFGSAMLVALAGFVAMPEAQAESLSNWLSQPTMTGNWGGVRTSLEDLGITPRASFLDQFAANPVGGMKQGGVVGQQVAFGLDLDMAKLAGIEGGLIHISLNYRTGRSDSLLFIGNKVAVQSSYGSGENFHISQFSWEQYFNNKKVDSQIGFLPDVGDYFANTPVLCDLENTAFCSHPFPLYVGSGVVAYPSGQWGGLIKNNFTPDFYTEGGIFEVNPRRLLKQDGFDVSLDGSTGAVFLLEAGYTVALGAGKLPGHYKVGSYYDTSTVADVAYSDIERSGRYGAYVLADQMLFRLNKAEGSGLIAFFQASVSEKRTSTIPYSLLGALLLQGPFSSRPLDYIAFGIADMPINRRVIKHEETVLTNEGEQDLLPLDQGETDMELGYGFFPAPWFKLNPNVQYIIDPGAFSYKHTPNAWVIGLQTKLTF